VRQPQFQRRGQTLAAQLLGPRPDPFDHLLHRLILGFRPGARPRPAPHPPALEQLDGIFPFATLLLAKLVEQPAFAFLAPPGIRPH
jgi:hypothetical protein